MSSKIESKNIIKGTSIVSLLTILSRVFGFLRDHVLARFLGAGINTDIFFVAFRLPNLLRNLVAEGALSSAFLPVLAEEKSKSDENAKLFFRKMLFLVFIITSILSIIGITFSEEIVSFVGVGFKNDPEAFKLCVSLSQIIFPYIIFVSNVALINAALITFNIYGSSAIAQILLNLVLIIGASFGNYLSEIDTLYVLAYATLLGGFFQVLIQFPLLKKGGLSFIYSFRIITPAIKKVFILFVPAFLGAATGQIITFLNTMLASTLIAGSVSWLHYADRLAQLPIGIFSVALGSVIFPGLAKNFANKEENQFNLSLINGLRYLSFVLIPASVFLFITSDQLVSFFFESGKFNSKDTEFTSIALKALSLSIWTTGCYSLLVRAFHARKDTKTPCLVSLLILVLSFNISLLLMGGIENKSNSSLILFLQTNQEILNTFIYNYFNLTLPTFGHVGLALTSFISSSIAFIILLGIFIKNTNINLAVFLKSTLKSLIASLLMGIAIILTPKISSLLLINLLIKCIVATFIYIFIALLLKSSEALETFKVFWRYFSK